MPDYTKRTPSGTDKAGNTIYANETAWYKKKRKRRKTRKKATRRTRGTAMEQLSMGRTA